uniref:Uncharacterized protein n=1 Tax=Mustela putorius furo TaxID=9669 RepID=M3YR76_MUSPF
QQFTSRTSPPAPRGPPGPGPVSWRSWPGCVGSRGFGPWRWRPRERARRVWGPRAGGTEPVSPSVSCSTASCAVEARRAFPQACAHPAPKHTLPPRLPFGVYPPPTPWNELEPT